MTEKRKRKIEVEISNEAFCCLAAIAFQTGCATPEEIAVIWLEEPECIPNLLAGLRATRTPKQPEGENP